MANDEEFKKINEDIKERLRNAEETLEAIRTGNVDAIVVKGPKGDQLYSLVSPEHPYQVFIENMEEAAIIASKEGKILYANSSFFEMIGSSSEKLMGSSFLDILEEKDRSFFLNCLQIEKKKRSELIILTSQGEKRTVLLSVSRGVWNEEEHPCLLLTDITQLKRAQHFVEASESIAKILSETTDLPVACNSIIRLLKSYLDWEVMVVWAWNKDKQMLNCMEIAHIPEIDIPEFVKKTKEIEPGKKLLSGHVWSSHRPVWMEDVAEDSTFFRRNEAIQHNLHGALAFPFYQNSEISGVIELFRRTPFKDAVDNLLLDLISSIGIEMGLYFQRLLTDQTKSQLARVLDLSLSGIYSTDMDGIVTSWNRAAEIMYGWSPKEMIGNSINRIYIEENTGNFQKLLSTFHSERSFESFKSQRLRKNGKLIWVNNVYGEMQDFFGKVTGLCFIDQDITSQKDTEETLTELKERYQSFIDITEDWIWEIDKEGTFQFSNQAVFVILGYEAQETVGKNLFYFLSFESRNKLESLFKAYVTKKEGWVHLELPFIHKNGSTRWLESNTTGLVDAEGELVGFRGASRDITESKNLEKLKNEFISTISHELRTPLTSIYGALSLMIAKEMGPVQKQELLQTAYRNSVRLTKLINDTIDLEKIQLGKLSFDFRNIDLRDVVLNAIHASEPIAEKFNVKLLVEGQLFESFVNGDSERLEQVMMNLLSNAIKFSPREGVVSIRMEFHDHSVRVFVTDHGPGIPKDFQPKLFQKFAQAELSLKRPSGSSGMGLYISKSILESHGGTIQYETKEGVGTTFFMELPLITGKK